MAIEIRKLGTVGLETSALGLGCMGMSEFYGAADESESIKVIHRAIDLGVTFLDTSDMYGPYLNETLLGKALEGKRQQVTLATKFGIIRNPARPMDRGVNGSPEYVRFSCEHSLKRLKTDVIDLYYVHRIDPATPIEDTIGTMADLIREGKIRAIGLSEASVQTIRRAHAVHPVTALQMEYSLWTRDPEKEFLSVCRELGIGFVAYSPLGRGFLTGTIKSFDELGPDDWRRNNPRFMPGNFEKNLVLTDRIKAMAESKNCTAAQLALAWVMAQGKDIFPIPGTKKMKYLIENSEATKIIFTNEELNQLDLLAPPDVASGMRYTDAGMQGINK
jgi:aryl-alcohol dehydrogenase-like predicted oxidoreductase